MNEENKNSITYDEGWQNVSKSEYPVTASHNYSENEDKETSNQNLPNKRKAKNSPKQLLITIQLILCILIALAALVIKSIGGNFYSAAQKLYYSNLNNSAIFDNSTDFNLKKLFGTATKDEV